MDLFEKQQTIEAIKTVVKARWFYVLVVFLQGIIAKIFFKKIPLIATPLMTTAALSALLLNFIYWWYLCRPPEKITDLGLKILKPLQAVFDILVLSALFYFSGTANKLMVVVYFIILVNMSSLYRKKGIILITLFAMLLYSGLVLLEYFGLMPENPQAFSPFRPLKGEPELAGGQLIAFNLYFLALAFSVLFLSDLFKRREKRLGEQKEELVQQTQELIQSKDQIQDSLVKSDVARRAATQARDELEKANLELKKKIDELEKFYKITVGREVRMVELKSQIKDLKDTIKKLFEEH